VVAKLRAAGAFTALLLSGCPPKAMLGAFRRFPKLRVVVTDGAKVVRDRGFAAIEGRDAIDGRLTIAGLLNCGRERSAKCGAEGARMGAERATLA
jgi:hypothetical protein